METTNIEEKKNNDELTATFSNGSLANLKNIRTWSNVVAIIFLIVIFIAIFIQFANLSKLHFTPIVAITALIEICALIVLVFCYYFLYDFSKLLKKAIANKDPEVFDTSLISLKKHFRLLGIITIIWISIALFSFILGDFLTRR